MRELFWFSSVLSVSSLTVRLASWNSGQLYFQDLNNSAVYYAAITNDPNIGNIVCDKLGFGQKSHLFSGSRDGYFRYMGYKPNSNADLSCHPHALSLEIADNGLNMTTDFNEQHGPSS